MRRAVLLTLALCLVTPTLRAQVEHVPASNPVYLFLQEMNVAGRIPGYSPTMLPMSRAEVASFLDALRAAPAGMTQTETARLARYADEFIAERDGTQKVVSLFDPAPGTPFLGGLFSDDQKFLYRWTNADRSTSFVMEFLGSLDARGREAGSDRNGVLLGQVGGRFRGTIGGIIGYQLQSTNGESFGDKGLALRDKDLRLNTNFGDLNRNFFDFTEAAVTASWSWGSASIGRETVLSGVGYSTRTLISGNAPAFDAVRLNLHTGDLRFSFLHGSLLGTRDLIENGRPYYDAKYIAMHRLEADLFRAVRFGVYEAVIYSERAIDLSYLNPVNFFKSAEHAGGDRDNPMLGIDMQSLSLEGVQFFGSWLIDDVDFSKWGTGWFGNKFAWQAGALNTSLVPNTMLVLEYGRVEPYTFSHVFRNNEYTNKGAAIGLDLPPNSDRWTLTVEHAIGARWRVTGQAWRQRHGMNAYDATGALVKNNGGEVDVNYVAARDSQSAPFLDGPRETVWSVSLGIAWEPLRDYTLRGTYRYTSVRDDAAASIAGEHLASMRLEIEF